MVAAGDFKNGITVEIDGNIYQILESTEKICSICIKTEICTTLWMLRHMIRSRLILK